MKIKRWIPLYLMMLPGLAYLFINNYIPMAGLVVAFKRFNARDGIWKSPWVGLDNFKFLFMSSKDAFIITRNTLVYNLIFIVLDIVLGIFIAVCICEIRREGLRKFYQSMMLLPFVMSIVIISYMVYGFLSADNGWINNTVLEALGKEPVSWYGEPKYWPFILIVVHCWKGLGYGCMLYIATILGIDTSYYEAAALDGASKLKQFRYITLPFLKPTVITLTLLSIGGIFRSDFGLFYQVTQNSGALIRVTNTIDTYVFRALIENGDMGRSAAAGFYQSIVGFILVVLSNAAVRKISNENALF